MIQVNQREGQSVAYGGRIKFCTSSSGGKNQSDMGFFWGGGEKMWPIYKGGFRQSTPPPPQQPPLCWNQPITMGESNPFLAYDKMRSYFFLGGKGTIQLNLCYICDQFVPRFVFKFSAGMAKSDVRVNVGWRPCRLIALGKSGLLVPRLVGNK